MAYDASYLWVEPRFRRLRRWFLRLIALVALAACAAGVYYIVHDAKGSGSGDAKLLSTELSSMQVTHAILAQRLDRLRPAASGGGVRSALDDARADTSAATAALQASDGGASATAVARLHAALHADRRYLRAVALVLTHPTRAGAAKLPALADAARSAFAALPRPSGLPATFHGYRRLSAYARAHAG